MSHHRGRLQASTDGTGGMLAIGLSESEVRSNDSPKQASADVVIAAVNGSESVTVAGPVEAIDALHADLESAGRLHPPVEGHGALPQRSDGSDTRRLGERACRRRAGCPRSPAVFDGHREPG